MIYNNYYYAIIQRWLLLLCIPAYGHDYNEHLCRMWVLYQRWCNWYTEAVIS